jgi:hypothetical protein
MFKKDNYKIENGEIIDYMISSEKDEMYLLFCKYFSNPILTKYKNNEKYSLYGCKTFCLLSKECRYIIVTTLLNKVPLFSNQELKDLEWESIQTRTLGEESELSKLLNKIKVHSYIPKSEGELKAKISRINISDKASTYICESLPLTVTILHSSKNNADSYQDKGSIISALETWQTIVTFR